MYIAGHDPDLALAMNHLAAAHSEGALLAAAQDACFVRSASSYDYLKAGLEVVVALRGILSGSSGIHVVDKVERRLVA